MSDLNIPLADDASQASRSSLSGSLLDRIRAQREKESVPPVAPVQLAQQQQQRPEPLNVPNYNNPEIDSSDPSNVAWSMDFSLLRHSAAAGDTNEAAMSLLGDEDGGGTTIRPYSMTRYFYTFVQDVYNAFRSLHPVAQVVIAVSLFGLALWLLDVM